MARLNLTLDEATFSALDRDARREKARLATHAGRLLREALQRRELHERRRLWAQAYRADRADSRRVIRDIEPGELELMCDEDA